ncbi:MAG: hypothetical protein ACOVRM_16220, partial [Planctomycetaceae bacterium]
GHSFVTTGPLLNLRFNDQLPGTVWRTTEAVQPVRVKGVILSQHPLDRVELVRNGVIEAVAVQSEQVPSGDRGYWKTALDHSVQLTASGWLAVRVFEQISGGKVSFAHSNPIFLDNPARPVPANRREVEYLVRRMDEELQRNAGVLSEEALDEYRRARDIYAAILPGAVVEREGTEKVD